MSGESKDIFDQAISKFKKAAFSFGQSKEPVLVEKIGFDWAPFGAIDGDKARMLDISDEAFLMMYRTPPGVFKKHFHLVNESGIVTKGEMTIRTSEGEYTVHEGESFNIGKGIMHTVRFVCNENELILNFHPPFKSGNWESSIVEESELN